MDYLKAAVALKKIIEQTNDVLLEKNAGLLTVKNLMRISAADDTVHDISMQAFTNDFVKSTLSEYGDSKCFVITDISTMDVQGTPLTYYLYKGYCSEIEKGLVYFQPFNKDTLKPIGELQFSNLEDNIFYQVNAPQLEESSCNAMETDKKIEQGKSIVFFIGHMDENRLIYDIQRLIFDTVNNVQKNKKVAFEFIINVAKFGGKPSVALKEQVKAIDIYAQKYVAAEYPNAKFSFEFDDVETEK